MTTTWQDIGTEGRPDDVVGHKTFDTGEIDPETGLARNPNNEGHADSGAGHHWPHVTNKPSLGYVAEHGTSRRAPQRGDADAKT